MDTFINFMSSLYVILFCNFVTIWCKDNKLIIYLSIYLDTFMENSAPSNVWTYYARWHRYFASLIETNVFGNFMSSLYIVLFCKFYVTIWCKDNKLIIYLSLSKTLTSCLIKRTISKEVAVMNLRTWLLLPGPSWYQEES